MYFLDLSLLGCVICISAASDSIAALNPEMVVQSSEGWAGFSAGWLVGGLSGVAWAYILTLLLPFYS